MNFTLTVCDSEQKDGKVCKELDFSHLIILTVKFKKSVQGYASTQCVKKLKTCKYSFILKKCPLQVRI
jgi:hypothetical protein